jgi:hypothetical protein
MLVLSGSVLGQRSGIGRDTGALLRKLATQADVELAPLVLAGPAG